MAELRERRRDGTRLRQHSSGSQNETQQLSPDVFSWSQTSAGKAITMPLIFSVFSTKARGFHGKFGHLKGVLFSLLLPTYSLTESTSTSVKVVMR